MKLINIGFGNLVSQERLVAIVSPDSAPIKRMVQETRERGMLIDATYGRKTASIFIMDSDHVILSALPPERFSPKEQEKEDHEGKDVYRFRSIRRGQEHGAQGPAGKAEEPVFFRVRHHQRPRPGELTASITILWMRIPSAKWIAMDQFLEYAEYVGNFTAPPSGLWMRPWIRGRM